MLRFLGLGGSTAERDQEPASLVEIGAQLDSLPPEEARFVAAFAYLLARIAAADLKTEAIERQAMASHIEKFGGLDADRAVLLSESAVRAADVYSPSDDHLVARAYRDMSDHADRIRLLRCLYAVAAADELITTVEENEVMDVALAIGVDHEDVVALRLEFKSYLGALKALPGER